MESYIKSIDIEHLKRAVQAEEKFKYINLQGRESTFAGFMLKQLRNIYRLSGKKACWKPVLEAFNYYAQETMLQRKKMIAHFASVLKSEIAANRTAPADAPLTAPSAEADKGGDKYQDSLYDTDISNIKGIGSRSVYLFNKLEIFSIHDLISAYPRKYIDYSARCLIKDLKEGENATVYGKIAAVSHFTTKKGLTILKVIVRDETGSIELNFFYGKTNKYMLERYRAQFPVHEYIIISGCAKYDSYNRTMTIDKPQYQTADAESVSAGNLNLGRIVPVYSLTENLSVRTFRKAVYAALETYSSQIRNIVPEEIIKKHNMLDKKEALREIHFPQSYEMLERARFALVYEEFFLLQMKMLSIRNTERKKSAVPPAEIKEDGLVMRFIKSLPFELTQAQKNAANEILNDMHGTKPMQRLLQGDVGSGKTVIACIMLLAAIENGYQGAIMAPTEILAQQHFNNFVKMLAPLGVSIGLFTSSNGVKQRRKLEQDLRNGQINIACGTHALIQENIEFNNLGASVIDEQHRFGVKQRSLLREKAAVPHMLTMTATPIPRTLALTVHGDLDLTVIDELPAGRKPIITELLAASQRRKAYELIRAEINKGHQAYIVFPLIEESETLSAKAAAQEAEKLRSGVFSDLNIGLLHGKMKPDEKEQAMADFKSGLYNILVCTTVVEVGVDVPNASVILIENAERFGLSQLHQLRGRTGRSSIQSYCILISSSRNEETMRRLNVMTQTNDGFVIAEKDLEIRGPGEFLGIKQSGIAELKLADLTKDAYILELARKETQDYIDTHKEEEYNGELKLYLNSVLSAVRDFGITD